MNERLLLLHDDQRESAELCTLLSSEGFDVLEAGTVREGFRFLENSFFDLVLTVLMLPDGSGIDVCRYCLEHCKKTRVICIASADDVSSAAEALRVGAHDYVTRPRNKDILLHTVRSVLERMCIEEELALERAIPSAG